MFQLDERRFAQGAGGEDAPAQEDERVARGKSRNFASSRKSTSGVGGGMAAIR
jgi:hypothetical protein